MSEKKAHMESRVCAECGKEYFVFDTQGWTYKVRGAHGHFVYLCSWKCMRAMQKRKEAKKMEKVELVYDPSIAAEYRMEQAKKAEEQRERDDRAAKERYMKEAEEAKEEGRRWMEETKRKMEGKDGYVTSAIRGEMGEFYYDKKYGTVDWRSVTGEEVSLMPEEWKELMETIPMMLEKLGVEV